MTVASQYDQFLDNVTSSLVAEGGQVVFTRSANDVHSEWGKVWDRIVFVNAPGSPVLYAVTEATRHDAHQVQQGFDDLAAHLARRGALEGSPLTLVAVLACDAHGRPAERSVARMKPRTYYPGLRPRAVVVDLGSGGVVHGVGRQSEAIEPVRRAASSSFSGPENAHELGYRQSQRVQAFYTLMQGRQPLVTYLIIAVNVGFFAAEYLTGALNDERTLENLGVLVPRLVEHGQVWRLLTTTFLHGSFTHILFNMTSLFAVGTLAERLYGWRKYLIIYFASGLIASLVSFGHFVMIGNFDEPALGASGAIFGVAGALITLRFQNSSVIPGAVRKRVSTSITPLILISLGMSSLIPNVDNWAHIGGLAGGMVLSLLVSMERASARAN